MMYARALIVVLSLITLGAHSQSRTQSRNSFDGFQFVDKMGNIRKPTNVRDTYQALGTFMVLDPKGNEMPFTYAFPGTAEAYRRTREICRRNRPGEGNVRD